LTRSWAAASAGPSNGAIPPLLSNAQPMTIGLAAADDVPAAIATTVIAAARSATTAPFFLRFITPSWERMTVDEQ